MATGTVTSPPAWTFPSSCYTSPVSRNGIITAGPKSGHSRSFSLPLPSSKSSSSFSLNSTSFIYHSTSPTSTRKGPGKGKRADTAFASSSSAGYSFVGSGYSSPNSQSDSSSDPNLHATTPRSLPRAKTLPFLPSALARLANQSPLPVMAEFEEIGLGEDTPETSPVKSFFSFGGSTASGSSNSNSSSSARNNSSSSSSTRSNSYSRRSQNTKQTTLSIPPTIPSVPNSPIAAGVPSGSLASNNSTKNRQTPPSVNPPSSRSLMNPASSSATSSPATPVQGGLSIPAKQSRRKRSPSPSRRINPRTSSRNRVASASASPVRPSHPPTFQQQHSSPNLTTHASASSSSSSLNAPSPFPRGPPQRSHTTPATMRPSPRLPHERRPRKTVEEMERECDEDSDGDIPDDTVFWNVPLSPRAGKSIPSNSPSPERLSLASESTAPGDETPGEETLSHSFSQNGISTPPPRNLSTTSLPITGSFDSPDRGRKKFRGKSWSDVMLELGDDAKDLTAALERHAESELAEVEKKLHKAVLASARTHSNPGRASSPIRKEAIALPPKQRGSSVEADPIPVSKEKEAVLSRTRPGWLPPKNPEEEKKHLKEYQEMMRLSLEADRKKAEKMKKEAELKIQTQISINKVWEDKIIPNWDDAIHEPETRELWWNGVAPKLRGLVWKRAFGNVLAVGEDTFQKALLRAKKTEGDLKGMTDNSIAAKSFQKIRQDVETTLVDYKLFQESCPLHQGLIDVLMAYAMYRSDIGYVYGLNVIAAVLLLNLNPSDAFTTLANIMNRPLPLSFYTQDESGMTKIYALFLRAFQYKFPRLHNHIHVKLCLPPPLYLEPIFSSLFGLHLPTDIVSRIWDVYAFEGDALLIRTAVAVMGILESRLYGTKEEVLSILGWDIVAKISGPEKEWESGKEDEFMAKVRAAGKEELAR